MSKFTERSFETLFVDVVYPPVDDPHIAGQAACAHCLAPIYAAGVVEVETVNLLMTSSTKMSDRERDVVLPKIVAGFQECCEKANAIMTQSPLALNPSLTISGQVNAFMNVGSREFVASDMAQKGDVLGKHISFRQIKRVSYVICC